MSLKSDANAFYVYTHSRSSNGSVFYVGKGKGRRAFIRRGRSLHWERVADKHGFYATIVADGLTEDEAFKIEREKISQFRAKGCGLVNQTYGGEGVSGHKHTPDAIKEISASSLEMWRDKSRREKIVASQTASWGNPAVRQARARSIVNAWRDEGLRLRRSKQSTDWWSRPENKRKMSEAHKLLRASPSVRQKMKEISQNNWKNDDYAKKVIDAKTSIKKRVICSNGMVFESAAMARRWLQGQMETTVYSGNIHKACRAAGALMYGYSWSYEITDENVTA